MRKFSKFVPLVAVASAAALALAGCSGTDQGGQDEPVKSIKFVAAEYSSNTAPYWQEVAEKFTDKTGIDVEVQVISWNDIHQQVSTMVQTDQLPDILNIDSFSEYAVGGLLWKTSEIESDALQKNFAQNLSSSGAVEGVEYGIPLIGSSSALFYNTDLFAEAGLTGPPTTFDELASDAKKISALQDKVGYALSLSPEAPQVDWSMFMFNNGGSYMTDGKWTINSDINVETLEYLNQLASDGATEINPGKTGRQDGTWQLFESGTAGMVIGQSALSDRLSKTDINYEIVPFPSAAGVEPTSLGIADYIMAFKKPGNQDAVSQFLEFAFDKANYLEFVQTEGLLPVTLDAQEALKDDAKFGPYIKALQASQFAPVGEVAWPSVLGQMKNSIGLAVQGDDPRAILDALQAVATK